MSERDWEKLSDLIGKIMRLPGSWQEKRDTVRREMDRQDADWEEFESWFFDLSDGKSRAS